MLLFSLHLIMYTTPERVEKAVIAIEEELEERVKSFKDDDKLLEAQRIEQRTKYDIEMLKEIGLLSRYRKLLKTYNWKKTRRKAIYINGLFSQMIF